MEAISLVEKLAAEAEEWRRRLEKALRKDLNLGEDLLAEATLKVRLVCGRIIRGSRGCVRNIILEYESLEWSEAQRLISSLAREGLKPYRIGGEGLVLSGRPPFIETMLKLARASGLWHDGRAAVMVEAVMRLLLSGGSCADCVEVNIGACTALFLDDLSDLFEIYATLLARTGAPCCPPKVRYGDARIVLSTDLWGEAPLGCVVVGFNGGSEGRLECKSTPGRSPALDYDLPGGLNVDPELLEATWDSEVVYVKQLAPCVDYLTPDEVASALRSEGEKVAVKSITPPGLRSGYALIVTGSGSVIVVAYDRLTYRKEENWIRILAPEPERARLLAKIVVGLVRGEEAKRRAREGLYTASNIREVVAEAPFWLCGSQTGDPQPG